MSGPLRQRVRRALPVLALALVVVVVAILTAVPDDSGLPLDPRSTGPLGTKAVVDVLGELGVAVEVYGRLDVLEAAAPPDTVLLLHDRSDDRTTAALERFVRDGGRLVVPDASSSFVPDAEVATAFLLEPTLRRECGLQDLAGADEIAVAADVVYDVPPGAVGCYPLNDGAWLVRRRQGRGAVIALGGADVFVNAALGEADNAVLAARVLAPEGDERVGVLPPALVTDEDSGQTLSDLVPPWVGGAVIQLLIAFGVIVLWRARRLGKPVVEKHPVQLPSSELVVAVGHLLQRTRSHARAATAIREDLRRSLCERLGLHPSSPVEDVAAVAGQRSEVSADDVLAVLRGHPRPSEAELVRLAEQAERLRATLVTPATPRSIS